MFLKSKRNSALNNSMQSPCPSKFMKLKAQPYTNPAFDVSVSITDTHSSPVICAVISNVLSPESCLWDQGFENFFAQIKFPIS